MCVKFEGKIHKKLGKYWPISIPALGVYTQGISKKDALFMLKDLFEIAVYQPGFTVSVTLLPGNRVIVQTLRAEDDKHLIAMLLKNQRAEHGLSIQEVANRLGVSKHAYAQYEQARATPSLSKIEEFISAMNKHMHVVLELVDENKAA